MALSPGAPNTPYTGCLPSSLLPSLFPSPPCESCHHQPHKPLTLKFLSQVHLWETQPRAHFFILTLITHSPTWAWATVEMADA